MRNTYLQKVIQKIIKKQKKILYSKEIKKLIQDIMQEAYTDSKAYKIIYYLKNKWYIISLKKNIFYKTSPEDTIHEQDIIEQYYRDILHTHCNNSFETSWYIWWIKAIELHYNNFSIPEIIHVVTQNKQSKEMILADKILLAKKYTSKWENYFPKFKKQTQKIKIWKHTFRIAKKELALLECMYNFDDLNDRYTHEITKKIIRKTSDLDIQNIEKILRLGKHHTSINRLYKIARKTNTSFAEALLTIIKKYSFVLDL